MKIKNISLKDLGHYVVDYWNDRQSLEQAVLVCENNPIDFRELERWSKNEGMRAKFNKFRRLLSK